MNTIKSSKTVQFAHLLFKDAKNYKALATYLEECKERLPVSVYMGYALKNEIKKPKLTKKTKIALRQFDTLLEQNDVDIIIPTANSEEGYKYVIVLHKIVASKERFVHYNPLKPIYIGGRGKKSEYYDPRMLLGIDEHYLAKVITPHWEIDYRNLPIEVKLQVGLAFKDKAEELNWIKEKIIDCQKAAKWGEYAEIHPFHIQKEKKVKKDA